MADSQHIFISYARNDGREYAARLDTDLTASGFRTWRDTRDIDPNQDFSAELEHAIAESSHVVCCITPDTRRDDSFVRREIGYALAVKKPVVPLVFENTLPPIHIVNVTRINADLGHWPQTVDEILTRLQHSDDQTYQQITLPVDPYREYLTALYDQIVRYLNLTVFSLISLRGEASPHQVEKTRPNVLPMAFFDMAGIDVGNDEAQFNNFQEAFDKYEGRVLLLGDPGAGKTTTLFAFARDTVAARLANPALPLPILVPVATWDAKQQTPLVDWLASQIPMLKHDHLKQLVDTGNVLLMLDGLDELGGQRIDEANDQYYDPRLRFMEQITPLIETRSHAASTRIVISCRVKDYDQIGAKFPLHGAVTLHRLNDVQMGEYLRDLPDLWAALEADADLREVARTPLLLSLFTFAFRDLPDQAKTLRNLRRGDLRDKIFETYVKKRYDREARKPNAKMPFKFERMIELLGQIGMWNVENDFAQQNIITPWYFEHFLEPDEIAPFINLALELNFFIRGRDFDQFPAYQFVHLLLRDYFAYHYALKMLNGPDKEIQFSAVHALSKLHDPRASQALVQLLQTERWYIRASAAEALGNLGDSGISDVLEVQLQDHDPKVRQSAAEALGKLLSVHAIPSLVGSLRDSSSHVRRAAAAALGQMKAQPAIEPLIRILEADDRLNRRSAADVLGQIGDPQAVDVLINALGDEDVYVRMSAAGALGHIGDAHAIPALAARLSDADAYVRSATRRALEQLNTPEALEVLAAWRKSQPDGKN